MANPIPFPLPDRPDQFQLDRQWKENYDPALKYGARLDSSQVVGGNITVEDTGIPVGVFDTLDFENAIVTDNGDGSVTIAVGGNVSSVDWSTTNWNNFFTDIDWSQNTDWTSFFTNIDWSDNTNWDSFVTSVVNNWSATNWDNFIDTFITNVDSDDVFNFLNQISGTAKGDLLVYDGATWTLQPVGADGLFLQANSATGTGLAYAAGGGGSPLTVQDEGINVDTATTLINFIGAGVTATSAGVGLVDVTIPGGSGGGTTQTYTAAHTINIGDPVGISDTVDDNVATAINGSIATDFSGVSTPIQIVGNAFVDTDKFVMSYSAIGGLYVAVGTIDRENLTVTMAGEQLVTATPSLLGDICTVDTNKFAVVYVDTTTLTVGTTRIGTVSGTTITLGTAATFGTGSGNNRVRCEQLTTDKVIYGGNSIGTSLDLFAATISGTTPTFGASATPDATWTGVYELTNVDTDKAHLVWYDSGSNAMASQIMTVAGTVITLGSKQNFGSFSTFSSNQTPETVSPATDVIVVKYSDNNGVPADREIIAGTISGTVGTYGTEENSNGAGPMYASSATDILSFEADGIERHTRSGANIGAGVLTSWNDDISTTAPTMVDMGSYWASVDTDFTLEGMSSYNWIGVATETSTRGNSIIVRLRGGATDTNQSGLQQGLQYRVNSGAFEIYEPSDLDASKGRVDVGVAVASSSTSIIF